MLHCWGYEHPKPAASKNGTRDADVSGEICMDGDIQAQGSYPQMNDYPQF